MNQQSLIIYSLVGGVSSAALSLLHLFPIPGILLLSYFAPLPLFLVGLGVGLRPLYGATLVASLLVLVIEGPALSAEFLISAGIGPVFLSYRALLHRSNAKGETSWYPGFLLLRDLTIVSGLMMLVGVVAYYIFTQTTDIHTLAKQLLETFDPQNHIKNGEQLLLTLFPLLPGFFAFSWAVMTLVNGTLAQGLLVKFGYNLRPSPSLSQLKAPNSFLIALCTSLIFSFIGFGALQSFGRNACFVLILPYFLIGLGVVHHWINKFAYATLILAIFYLSLLLLFWPAICVILVGILKPWIESKKKQ